MLTAQIMEDETREMVKIKKSTDGIALVCLALAALALILFVSVVVLSKTLASYDMPFLTTTADSGVDRLGQIGDFFGGVLNPILSFFAFIAVVISFRAQARSSKKSEDASIELSISQSKQLEQLSKQSLIAEKQAFENVFFGLLQIHSTNAQGFLCYHKETALSGQAAFVAVEEHYKFANVLQGCVNQAQWPGVMQSNIDRFKDEIYTLLGHYQRTANQILLYIHTASNLADDDKKRYAEIYSSTMSAAEVECLFLCLMSDNAIDTVNFFDHYSFFKGYPSEGILQQMRLRQFKGMKQLP